MSDKQPDAVGYAICLEARGFIAEAKEFRRISDVNTKLLQALRDIYNGSNDTGAVACAAEAISKAAGASK